MIKQIPETRYHPTQKPLEDDKFEYRYHWKWHMAEPIKYHIPIYFFGEEVTPKICIEVKPTLWQKIKRWLSNWDFT